MDPRRVKKALAVALFLALLGAVLPASAAGREFRIGIVEFRQFSEQNTCSSVDALTDAAAGSGAPLSGRLPQFSVEHFKRGDCVLIKFVADGGGATTEQGQAPTPNPAPTFSLKFFRGTTLVDTVDATLLAGATDTYGAFVKIADTWPAGRYRVEAVPTSSGDTGKGVYKMTVNGLGTRIVLEKPLYKPGETIHVNGVTWKSYQIGRIVRTLNSYPEDPTQSDNVPATGTVTLVRADGRKVSKEFTALSTPQEKGFFSVEFSPSDYGNVAAGAEDGFVRSLRLSATATYTDPITGEWRTSGSEPDSEAVLQFESVPDSAQVHALFTSETGWVEPGSEYVHQIEYRNVSRKPASGVTVTYNIPDAARYVKATPAPSSVGAGTLTWNIGSIASGSDWAVARRILITMRALSEDQDRTVVWKNLSATVSLSQSGVDGDATSLTHGPRVATLDTARYGDRPFPVVLVDYLDAKHSPARPGWYYEQLINQPLKESSLVNLYREMSFGQLFPHGIIPSVEAKDPTFGAASSYKWATPYGYAKADGSVGRPGGVCYSATSIVPDPTSPVTEYTPSASTARIAGGWYQLPGQQAYYGGDQLTFGQYAVRLAGNAGLGIDGACGPTGKAAFDAASIADPDIDYNDFDTDRNGLVDFFMFIFRGIGGNGASQTQGYDNIWPHSSSLESYFADANGQLGYVSHDQLRDRLERPLWWKTAKARSENKTALLTTKNMGADLKAYVRVGPYNANPEISTTSVIAHEYGHSLGLPDYYSTSTRETVGNWELMSNDNAQFMSVFSRQDLGWLVPKVLARGSIIDTINESKVDTHRVEWTDAHGRPYTLTGSDVHNGDAYYVPLPHTSILDKATSGKKVWWSQQGDDFGCPGHTLDIPLHLMKGAASGDTVTLSFKSWYEIEWDFDYGFVMVSKDGGKTFEALESKAGTTTPQAFSPNQVSCQDQFGNGITGTSMQRNFPSNVPDRSAALDAYTKPDYIEDSFDLSPYAGQDVILRFAYATDSGLAKRGWFIDDLKVVNQTQSKNYLQDDSETTRPDYIPQGWINFTVGSGKADRGYYLELRDRISFDFDGRGQADRTAIDWIPGVSLWWTDEFTGYGNVGQAATEIPRQNPIDARPEPGTALPRLADAAFYPINGLNAFNDSSHVDNYGTAAAPWTFGIGCFSMRVLDIDGLGQPGATAKLQMAANAAKCRAVPNTAVLGEKISKPSGSKRTGGNLPATGVDAGLFGLALLAAAAGIGRRLHSRLG
ncbi:MAG: immune inhibitor A domain-containing protein [Actinomycetota bacterium]|nr:immune inhibitor A [Actinomycetota bacterium]